MMLIIPIMSLRFTRVVLKYIFPVTLPVCMSVTMSAENSSAWTMAGREKNDPLKNSVATISVRTIFLNMRTPCQ